VQCRKRSTAVPQEGTKAKRGSRQTDERQ
jgi:hypothetical protein